MDPPNNYRTTYDSKTKIVIFYSLSTRCKTGKETMILPVLQCEQYLTFSPLIYNTFNTVVIFKHYISVLLSVNPCTTAPCQNGGTCFVSSVNNGYMCTCPTTHGGVNCEIEGKNILPLPLLYFPLVSLVICRYQLCYMHCVPSHIGGIKQAGKNPAKLDYQNLANQREILNTLRKIILSEKSLRIVGKITYKSLLSSFSFAILILIRCKLCKTSCNCDKYGRLLIKHRYDDLFVHWWHVQFGFSP